MKVSVVVAKGKDKKACEDSALLGKSVIYDNEIQLELDAPTVICVADGVGGNLGGELASRFLLEKISEWNTVEYSEEGIRVQLSDMNTELLSYADCTEDKKQMATTLTGLVLDETDLFYMQSGNSRLYIMQGNYLKQITKDQTTYQWLKDCGNDEAAEACNKNEIRGCFGGGNSAYINSLVVKRIENGINVTKFLLTSDGIHEFVDIDTMESILAEGTDDMETVKKLVGLALENGSKDDMTAVIIRR